MNRRINRRDFALRAACCAALPPALAAFTPGALAQPAAPVEGRDFVRLERPAPVAAADGKVEVVEFFGYWCPHCHAFEPELEAWSKRQDPAKVVLRRVPVAFRPGDEALQRLYYAIEATGQVDALHRKVFQALHVDKRPMQTDEQVLAWLKTSGGDAAKVAEATKSFGVATKARQSRALMDAYSIDSVPTLGVHGRWRTSPSMAGGGARALAVVDALAARARA